MEEVYPGIFLIKEKGRFGVFKPPENVYVFPGKNGLIFDAGYGTKRAINYLVDQIKKLEKIFLDRDIPFNLRILPSHAHPDHISGTALLNKEINANIILTKKMAEIIKSKKKYYRYYESDNIFKDLIIPETFWKKIRFKIRHKLTKIFYRNIYGLKFVKKVDRIIEEDTSININDEEWEVLSSPGHCLTHISLYNEKKGVLLAGDNVLRTITTWLGPPSSNIKDYLSTIQKYQKLPKLNLILPSHGSPIHNPNSRLEEIIKHRKSRSEQVLEIICNYSANGITLEDIIEKLYPNESNMKKNVARGWICLTLRMFEDQNKILRKIRNNKIYFLPD